MKGAKVALLESDLATAQWNQRLVDWPVHQLFVRSDVLISDRELAYKLGIGELYFIPNSLAMLWL